MLKRIMFTLMALCLCVSFAGCGGDKKAEAPKSDAKPAAVTKKAEAAPAPANGKVLVAYFSWGGATRKVAQTIQQKTGGDLFEIKTATPYPADYHATVDIGKKEKADNVRPKLAGPLPDMKQYDVILLGYPIWWYIEPMAVKTFVEAQDLSGKTILPFATSGGSGVEGSVDDLRKTLPKAQVKDGILLNSTSGLDGWLKDNGLGK